MKAHHHSLLNYLFTLQSKCDLICSLFDVILHSVAMMDTLKLIRDGVRLRKTHHQKESDDSPLSSLTKPESWENTELYRAIEKVRKQVGPGEDESDDSEDDSDAFN